MIVRTDKQFSWINKDVFSKIRGVNESGYRIVLKRNFSSNLDFVAHFEEGSFYALNPLGDLVPSINGVVPLPHSADFRNSTSSLTYSAINFSVAQQGSILFLINSGYNDIPAAGKVVRFFSLTGIENNENFISLLQNDTGNLILEMTDSNGVALETIDFGSYNFVSGDDTWFEIVFNLESQSVKLFINGVLFSEVSLISPYLRNAYNHYLIIGSNDLNEVTNYQIGLFAIYSQPLRNSDYTIDEESFQELYVYPQYAELISDEVYTNNLKSLDVSFTGDIRVSIIADGVDYYYDLMNQIWKEGGGLREKANQPIDLTPYVMEQLLTAAKKVSLHFYFRSDRVFTPVLEDYTLYFNLAPMDESPIEKVAVFGWVTSANGDRIENCVVEANLSSTVIYNKSKVLTSEKVSAIPDLNGYWELLLPTNDRMTPNSYWFISIKRDNKVVSSKRVYLTNEKHIYNYVTL